jgi:hypothetical protein
MRRSIQVVAIWCFYAKEICKPLLFYFVAQFMLNYVLCSWCWGWNRYGQIGEGSTDNILRPIRIIPRQDPSFYTQPNNNNKRRTSMLHARRESIGAMNASTPHTGSLPEPMSTTRSSTSSIAFEKCEARGPKIVSVTVSWRQTLVMTSTYQVFGWGVVNNVNSITFDGTQLLRPSNQAEEESEEEEVPFDFDDEFYMIGVKTSTAEKKKPMNKVYEKPLFEPFQIHLYPNLMPFTPSQSIYLGEHCQSIHSTSSSSVSLAMIDVELNDDELWLSTMKSTSKDANNNTSSVGDKLKPPAVPMSIADEMMMSMQTFRPFSNNEPSMTVSRTPFSNTQSTPSGPLQTPTKRRGSMSTPSKTTFSGTNNIPTTPTGPVEYRTFAHPSPKVIKQITGQPPVDEVLQKFRQMGRLTLYPHSKTLKPSPKKAKKRSSTIILKSSTPATPSLPPPPSSTPNKPGANSNSKPGAFKTAFFGGGGPAPAPGSPTAATTAKPNLAATAPSSALKTDSKASNADPKKVTIQSTPTPVNATEQKKDETDGEKDSDEEIEYEIGDDGQLVPKPRKKKKKKESDIKNKFDILGLFALDHQKFKKPKVDLTRPKPVTSLVPISAATGVTLSGKLNKKSLEATTASTLAANKLKRLKNRERSGSPPMRIPHHLLHAHLYNPTQTSNSSTNYNIVTASPATSNTTPSTTLNYNLEQRTISPERSLLSSFPPGTPQSTSANFVTTPLVQAFLESEEYFHHGPEETATKEHHEEEEKAIENEEVVIQHQQEDKPNEVINEDEKAGEDVELEAEEETMKEQDLGMLSPIAHNHEDQSTVHPETETSSAVPLANASTAPTNASTNRVRRSLYSRPTTRSSLSFKDQMQELGILKKKTASNTTVTTPSAGNQSTPNASSVNPQNPRLLFQDLPTSPPFASPSATLTTTNVVTWDDIMLSSPLTTQAAGGNLNSVNEDSSPSLQRLRDELSYSHRK